jgi:hypothetical protein
VSRGGLTPVTRGVDTGDDLTRTTELEPNNDISKKAKQVPSDWKPSPEFAIECNEKFPTLTIANEVEAFIDYHTANGSTFKDFNAAFRTWCRNAVKFQAPKTVIHQQQQSKSPHVGGPRIGLGRCMIWVSILSAGRVSSDASDTRNVLWVVAD